MNKLINTLEKAFIIIARRRLKDQGLYTSALWVWGRVLPWLTGIPVMRFCEVTPDLYVGPQFRKNGLRMLERHGIRAVVNLREEKDDAARGLAAQRYCFLPTVDDEAPSKEDIDRGVAFIREQISNGEKVYIHCGAGVGRAPTLAVAYLVYSGKSLDEALAMIRKVRPFIFITPPQMSALEEYEADHKKAASPQLG